MKTLPNWIIPLGLPMPATLGSVNVYLIRGREENALIDTGMNDAASVRALSEHLGRFGLKFSDITHVVCTHHHADHAGLGRTFRDTGAEVLMSVSDAASLRDFFEHPELDNKRATFFDLHQVPEEFATRVAPMFPFFRGLAQSFAPTGTFTDRQVVRLGGYEFTVLLTPGHTMGHLCLLHDDTFILTGDCVTPGNATHISMRRDVMGTDPLGRFLRSLETLGGVKVATTLPGHGKPIYDLNTRTIEIAAHHKRRLAQVEASLTDAPRTAFEITSDSFGKRPKPFARWLAMSQTLAYLEHLESLGRCESSRNSSGMVFEKPSDS